jgi:hypothetical protein
MVTMWSVYDAPEYANCKLLSFDDFNHFTAFVLAALGAGAMGADFFVTVRAIGQLRDGQGIMGPAGGRAPL